MTKPQSPRVKFSRVARICPVCQKTYHALVSLLRRGKARTCGVACRNTLCSQRRHPQKHFGRKRQPRIPRVCPVCLTYYEVTEWEMKGGKKKGCSLRCSMILGTQDSVRWQETHKKGPRTTPEHRRMIKQRKNATYRARHRAELSAKQTAYIKANPEVKHRAQVKRRALKWQTEICDFTLAQWRALKDLYDHRCAYCGETFERLTMDHVIALSKGGNHTLRNIVPACRSCNSSKGRRALPLLISPKPFYDLIKR